MTCEVADTLRCVVTVYSQGICIERLNSVKNGRKGEITWQRIALEFA